jgi:hypothetical protein
MFFKYFEGNYYVQYSRFRFRRSKARHPGDPAATGAKQSPEAGRQSERQAERAAEVNNSAIELERPGTVPGLFLVASALLASATAGSGRKRIVV